MSYILEALAKSEQERKQRAVPDLQTQHTLYPGVSRSRTRRIMRDDRRLPPGLVTVVAVVLILTAAYYFRDHIPVALEIKILRQDAQLPLTTEKESTATTIQALNTETLPDNALTSNPRNTINDRIDATSTSGNIEADNSPGMTISSTRDISPAETVTVPSAPQNPIDETIIAEQRITLEPAPILFSESGDSSAIVTVSTLPFLEELPASIQNDLPTMKFAGHTYADAPEDRLIIINNSIKRQGEPLQQGLRLEEITWDGVILNYKGLRFQVITTNS